MGAHRPLASKPSDGVLPPPEAPATREHRQRASGLTLNRTPYAARRPVTPRNRAVKQANRKIARCSNCRRLSPGTPAIHINGAASRINFINRLSYVSNWRFPGPKLQETNSRAVTSLDGQPLALHRAALVDRPRCKTPGRVETPSTGRACRARSGSALFLRCGAECWRNHACATARLPEKSETHHHHDLRRPVGATQREIYGFVVVVRRWSRRAAYRVDPGHSRSTGSLRGRCGTP